MNAILLHSLRIAGLILACVLFLVRPLHADARLPAIFGDHMVLQQEQKVPVWGTADPGEKVVVIAGDHTGTATADEKGKWRVDLAPFAASDQTMPVDRHGPEHDQVR